MHLPRARHWILAAAIATAAPLLSLSAAHAEAPQVKTQAPGFYRMALGQFEITALYDGYVDLDPKLLKNASQRDIQRLLAHRFQDGPKMQTAVNAYVINTGSKLVLVDAGAAKVFGPSLGYITDNLKAAGYDPAQIDAVLLTHLHGDHANGVVGADGKAVFPKAVVYAAQNDADFWLAEGALEKAPESGKPFFQMAQAAVAPYRADNRFKTLQDGDEIVPGIKAVAAYGHTPGHSGFLVESGDKRLLIWGDIVHNAAVQFAKPEVAIEFDVDSKQAVRTREAVFKRVAREKLLVAGMHLPFPGIGHVRRAEKGSYEWVPVDYSPVRE
ncbi:MBL fold metallo-hydrolase [Azoarcus olearius]|uniref:Probable metallo-beta-lactamase superfamily protein n=1 Tax=Azoarcus sp. (strain BH72) TaxID=418699 RepID=A1K258_AZOSB|nr:MBL fold metallo-hydrolase [Azoarcus olearius]CAL92913.1 probable metallo-beta-lactamase superfamily protein [Azoarcus olearius]